MQVSEAFKPIPVRCGEGRLSRLAFVSRQVLDLQLLTCVRFLKPNLRRLEGSLLDVGCGERPFRCFIPSGVRYVGLDVPGSAAFGMGRQPDVVLFDGLTIPFPDNSWDNILCTEVLEHAPEPEGLVREMLRVLRPGGTLLLTVPFAARVHHVPHDYRRFTRFCLQRMLAGCDTVEVIERGNDYAVIANKMIVLTARLLAERTWVRWAFTLPWAIALMPLTVVSVLVAHISMGLGLGSLDDPLGYGCRVRKARGDAAHDAG
jgi:SAM-dependent methyltransferase